MLVSDVSSSEVTAGSLLDGSLDVLVAVAGVELVSVDDELAGDVALESPGSLSVGSPLVAPVGPVAPVLVVADVLLVVSLLAVGPLVVAPVVTVADVEFVVEVAGEAGFVVIPLSPTGPPGSPLDEHPGNVNSHARAIVR